MESEEGKRVKLEENPLQKVELTTYKIRKRFVLHLPEKARIFSFFQLHSMQKSNFALFSREIELRLRKFHFFRRYKSKVE
jgi:hypothetical protein